MFFYHKKKVILFFTIFLIHIVVNGQTEFYLDELDLEYGTSGWKKPQLGTNIAGESITLDGKIYERGVGVHVHSNITLDLAGKAKIFHALVGVDDMQLSIKNPEKVIFQVKVDGTIMFESKPLDASDDAIEVKIDLKNKHVIQLIAKIGKYRTNGTFANWADAKFLMEDTTKPFSFKPKGSQRVRNKDEITTIIDTNYQILTPEEKLLPNINTPQYYGARSNSKFMYYIPVSGERPLKYAITYLPRGLSLDQSSGIISGKIENEGEYKTEIIVSNNHGSDTAIFNIICGSDLCLTPPMGWNSWNVWGPDIDNAKIREAARIFKENGLIDYGWTYINIDDGWQGHRDTNTQRITANEKFPDMKELCNYIHSLGLKIGIYSTPWINSYMNLSGGSADTKDGKIINARKDFGVYQFHEQDAQQYASWGIDYLKYDWANEPVPFTVAMHDALQKTDRDIILSISGSVDIGDVKSISQYSNLWRVNPDINDSWKSIYSRGFYHDRWSPYQSVGHWNDPDMLTVGVVGWGKSLHDTKLTPNEQYTHISLWALFSAPMILGCDLSQLDDFTLGLLKNNEVISINQDPKGRPAEHIVADYQNGKHVFVKKLYDGTYAIGLFNTSAEDQTIKFNIKDFHFTGKMLRDVWRQKDIGKAKEGIEAKVKPHGVVLLKVY